MGKGILFCKPHQSAFKEPLLKRVVGHVRRLNEGVVIQFLPDDLRGGEANRSRDGRHPYYP